MPIDPLPSISRSDANFRTQVDDYFLTRLPAFSTQAESARGQIVAAESTATSAAGTAATAATTATTAAGTATSASASAVTAKNAAEAAAANAISTPVAAPIHAATAKTTPADADELGISDSAASWGLKKLTFTNLKAWIGSLFVSKSGGTMTGDLNFSGAGRRITGDFSNATVANRLMFQSNVANSNTGVMAIPNGTSSTAGFRAVGNSDPTNASILDMVAIGNSEARIASGAHGSGALLPLTVHVGGVERLRIDPTTGNVLVTGGGGLGYGAGSGGTATQPTSNISTVVINKANGTITLANGSIAGNAAIAFQIQNSFAATSSIAVVHGVFDGSSASIAQFVPQVTLVEAGRISVRIVNTNAATIATDNVKIRFAIFAGSTS